MKIISEDLSIPSVEGEITTIDIVPEGPELGEDVGIANLILDAINTSTQKLQEYNIMSANIQDERLQEVLNSIMASENETLGKLQSMLKEVSPNAELIMNGAVDAEQSLSESLKEDLGKIYSIVDIETGDRFGEYDSVEQAKSKAFQYTELFGSTVAIIDDEQNVVCGVDSRGRIIKAK